MDVVHFSTESLFDGIGTPFSMNLLCTRHFITSDLILRVTREYICLCFAYEETNSVRLSNLFMVTWLASDRARILILAFGPQT